MYLFTISVYIIIYIDINDRDKEKLGTSKLSGVDMRTTFQYSGE